MYVFLFDLQLGVSSTIDGRILIAVCQVLDFINPDFNQTRGASRDVRRTRHIRWIDIICVVIDTH